MEARNPQQESTSHFWLMTMRCCMLAGSVDIAFFFMFHYLGSPILAWVNVISVPMYAVAYLALRRRQNRLALTLIWLEVLIHSALGTLLIGWHSGFHYYLLMFIPALFAGNLTMRSAVLSVFCLWLFYVALNTTMRFVGPIQPISDGALMGVNLFNLTVVFIMFSYLSVYYITMVKRGHRALRRMATIDPLTRLFNRGHMTELAARTTLADTQQVPKVTFLLMDVDFFKQLNDRFGHDFGDRVLCEIGQVISSALREEDQVGRWGGEEFLAVLPDTDVLLAQSVAERIRAAVANHDWAKFGLDTPVTLSIGVSQFQSEETFGDSIARADAALYVGKASGRNRVELAASADGRTV